MCRARHFPNRTHDLRSCSKDHHQSKNSVQKTTRFNSTSNAPDDGRMYPKHVELRKYQYSDLVASSWHFTLFHAEDTRSNNTQPAKIYGVEIQIFNILITENLIEVSMFIQ